MPRIGSFISAILLFIAIAAATAGGLIHASFQAAAHSACRLVSEHYYRANEERVRDWVKRCKKTADQESFELNPAVEVARINRRLDLLEVSHLTLFSPTENRQLWENESLDTGLRARLIDDRLVIYDVLEGGAAEAAGILPGDIVVSVENQAVHSALEVETLGGLYIVERAGKTFSKLIEPSELSENLAPFLESISPAMPNVGLLRIPSFLAQYFDKKDWLQISSALGNYSSLIIDPRGNAGGEFPGDASSALTIPLRTSKNRNTLPLKRKAGSGNFTR